MADKKVNNKEIVLRQWFAARYGNQFEDHSNWRLPKQIAELNREYTRDNPNMPFSFNFLMYKVREIEMEVRETGTFRMYDEIMATEYVTSSDSFERYNNNSTNVQSVMVPHVIAAPIEVTLNVQKLDDMTFPTFRDFPTETAFDRICSDDDELKGCISGMVIICTGESGVGKSTLLVDVMAKMRKVSLRKVEEGLLEKAIEPLYISTEMTKTDIYFYKKKMPAIGQLNTLLISDYLKHGLKEVLVKAFNSEEYDFILLDSYQDLVEKMQDALQWRAKEAENFLIELMVRAAEESGKCIIAIQHLTKGGEYVGRTFLKHTTTAMLELRFDKGKARYATFTKNRRAGSMTHIPMYFTMRNGEIIFDEAQFETLVNSNVMSESITERQAMLDKNFESFFRTIKDAAFSDDDDENALRIESDELVERED